MRRFTTSAAFVLLTVPAFHAYAQDHPRHDSAEKLGTVHFATSCNPKVAPQFDRAVALLHSFEFGASIRAFNHVLASDSHCAMAYCAIALSRWSNPMAAGNPAVAVLHQDKKSGEAADPTP